MNTPISNRRISRFALPALTLLVTLASTPPILAQQSDRGSRESMRSSQSVAIEKKPSAEQKSPKLTGRLPSYFSAVVSPEQRSEIYRIRKDYAAKMKAIQEQLAVLKADEMKEMEAVLSKMQLKQVGEMRERAKERIASKRVASAATPNSAPVEKTTQTANPKDKS